MLEISVRHHLPGFDLAAELVAPPGVTAVFGRSGAGKTTLVRAVAGLLRADAGRVVVDGQVLQDSAAGIWLPPHKRRIGYVFQDARLFPHMSVQRNLTYGLRGAPSRVAEIVDLLGIGPVLTRRTGQLSGGEAQRVALGRALLSDPRLLLMDEPLSALDGPRKDEILPYLDRICHQSGVPILYVSHSVSEIARLATTVAVMEVGRVTRVGPVAEVLADPEQGPELGPREAGGVLTGRVVAHHDDGLSEVSVAGGTLWLPRVSGAPGRSLRVRVAARDVMLSLDRPERISALNVLPAKVRQLRPGQGPGVMVQLDAGGDLLLARITRRSAEALALQPGTGLFAVIKSVSVARADVGTQPQAPDP